EIALSNFARKKYGTIEAGTVTVDPDANPADDPEHAALEALAGGDSVDDGSLLDRLASRGLIEREETTVREVQLTEEGVTALMEGVKAADTVGQLTPELLTSGEFRDVEFAEYNVAADAERIDGG